MPVGGLTDAQLVTLAVIVFFVLLAIVSIVRVILRREGKWRRIRMGVFVERDLNDDNTEGDL